MAYEKIIKKYNMKNDNKPTTLNKSLYIKYIKRI